MYLETEINVDKWVFYYIKNYRECFVTFIILMKMKKMKKMKKMNKHWNFLVNMIKIRGPDGGIPLKDKETEDEQTSEFSYKDEEDEQTQEFFL